VAAAVAAEVELPSAVGAVGAVGSSVATVATTVDTDTLGTSVAVVALHAASGLLVVVRLEAPGAAGRSLGGGPGALLEEGNGVPGAEEANGGIRGAPLGHHVVDLGVSVLGSAAGGRLDDGITTGAGVRVFLVVAINLDDKGPSTAVGVVAPDGLAGFELVQAGGLGPDFPAAVDVPVSVLLLNIGTECGDVELHLLEFSGDGLDVILDEVEPGVDGVDGFELRE
jgi:hypothetical protein